MNTYQEYLKEMIKKLKNLGKIKSVAWHLKEDDRIEWNWVAIRLEDENGQVVEIVRHSLETMQKYIDLDEVLINLVIVKCQLHGHWVGVTCNLTQAVDELRNAYPYVGIRFVNEHDVNVIAGWERLEYIW